MSRFFDDYYDDYDYDDDYHKIIYDANPKLVDDVSMLRHFINCHGVTKNLKKHLGLTHDQISEICDVCKGSTSIKELRKNYDEVIKKAWETKAAIEDAKMKNLDLIAQLEEARNSFCGIDTRNIKLLLNKLSKQGDLIAKTLRTLLEAEDENIKAKSGWKSDYHYNQKYNLVLEAINLYKEQNLIYGYQDTSNPRTNCIIYFELPNTSDQISFHMNVDNNILSTIPQYPKDWDNMVNSTIPKIEKAILSIYPDQVQETIEKKKIRDLKKQKKEELIKLKYEKLCLQKN